MKTKAHERTDRPSSTVAEGFGRPLAAWSLACLAASAGPARAEVWHGSSWETVAPAAVNMSQSRTAAAVQFGRDRGGSGVVVRWGKRVAYWGDQRRKYDLKSTTKSFGSIIAAVAFTDGRIDPETLVRPILMRVQKGTYCTIYPFELASCPVLYPNPTWADKAKM